MGAGWVEGVKGGNEGLGNVPFLCLLEAAARITEELVPLAQHLAGAELP